MGKLTILCFLVLLSLLFYSSNSYDGSRRQQIGTSFDCKQMSPKVDCIKNSKCRWCTSEDIDDMCFSSAEAWRLPQHVFTCNWRPSWWYFEVPNIAASASPIFSFFFIIGKPRICISCRMNEVWTVDCSLLGVFRNRVLILCWSDYLFIALSFPCSIWD